MLRSAVDSRAPADDVVALVLGSPQSHENDDAAVAVLVETFEGVQHGWANGYDRRNVQYAWEIVRRLAVGGHASFNAALDAMAASHASPRCGEVWTASHVAYRCTTCGLSDSSCQCVHCFDPEDHVGHDFRLYSSGAGGCCDCGDPQAWKESGFCSRHRRSAEAEAQMYHVDAAVERGATIALRAVLQHLIWAMRRAFYQSGAPDPAGCYAVVPIVDFIGALAGSSPGLRLLTGRWLLAKLPAHMLAGTYQVTGFDLVADSCVVHALLRLGLYLPNPIPDALGAHFLHLLLDAEFKERFTTLFVASYPALMNTFVRDAVQAPQENLAAVAAFDEQKREDERWGQQPPAQSVFPRKPVPPSVAAKVISRFLDRIFCQLFHSEAVVLQELSHFDLLEPMFAGVEAICIPIDLESPRLRDSKYSRLFSDIALVLNHHPVVARAAAQRRDIWAHVLSVLDGMQGMDAQQRVPEGFPHVMFESHAYRVAFGLSHDVAALFWPLVAAQCKGGEAWVRDRMRETEHAIARCLQRTGNADPSSRRMSLHVPLVRVWAAQMASNQAAVLWSSEPSLLLRAAEHVMSAMAFGEQVATGLWVRNGLSLRQQLQWCCDRLWSFDMIDRDVAVLQAAVVACGAEAVFSSLLRWGTEEWALRVMAVVVCDRMGCGSLDSNAKARRCIVQALAAREMPFSEVEKHVMLRHRESANVEAILASVANFATTRSDEMAVFSLKREAWVEVCFGGLWPRWSSEDEERALASWRKALRKSDGDAPAPPELAPLPAGLATVPGRVLEAVKSTVLRRLRAAPAAEDAACLNLAFWAASAHAWGDDELAAALEANAGASGGVNGARARLCLRLLGRAGEEPARASADKKRAGQALQQRIMRQYQQRQSAFAVGSGGEDADGDAEGDDVCAFCSERVSADSEPLRLIASLLPSSTLDAEQVLLFAGDANVVAMERDEYRRCIAPHVCLASLRDAHAPDVAVHACGHHAHDKCVRAYLHSSRSPDAHLSPSEGEMLCPLCRRFSNARLPLVRWDSPERDDEAKRFWRTSRCVELAMKPARTLAGQLSALFIATRGRGGGGGGDGDAWAEGRTFLTGLRYLVPLAVAGADAHPAAEPAGHWLLSQDLLVVLCRRLCEARPATKQACLDAVVAIAGELLALARVQDALYDALEVPSVAEEDWTGAVTLSSLGGGGAEDDDDDDVDEAAAAWREQLTAGGVQGKLDACRAAQRGLVQVPFRASQRDVLEARIRLLVAALDGDAAMELPERDCGNAEALVDAWTRKLAKGASLAARLKSSATLQPRLFSRLARPGRLVALPRDFAALTLRFIARGAACDTCQQAPKHPALCLLCGRLLCVQEECCAVNGVDELFGHEEVCVRGGSGLGAVMLLQGSSVVLLLLGRGRVCVYGSPYLDDHREEDLALSRGRPLYLDADRAERLDRAIAAAGLLEDTKMWAKMARTAMGAGM